MSKTIVFSGIQPTGNLHIGNYLGAVKNWIDLQKNQNDDRYFCVVDYHSLTGDRSSEERHEQTIRTATELLALGIDGDKSIFFIQSHVPEHTELAWIFNCVTPVAELYRMTQFKDKSERQEKNINTGLLTYPILMAADILLYKGTMIPVGQDQIQHVELTRDIARWFNKRYGDYFPEAKPLLTEFPKVMSLLEPDKKMSKSKGTAHVIELADEPEIIRKKLAKAVTATEGGGKAPGVANLFLLLKHFANHEIYHEFLAEEKQKTIRYSDLKNAVADAISSSLAEFRARRLDLLAHPEEVERILQRGAERAKAVADRTMKDVRKLVGIR